MSTTRHFAEALEMVRWAPSASNKQPWRVVRDEETWHFYLERVSDPNKGRVHSVIKIADLQRVDMGIAMYHFELGVKEAGATGHWVVQTLTSETASVAEAAAAGWEYITSWVSD